MANASRGESDSTEPIDPDLERDRQSRAGLAYQPALDGMRGLGLITVVAAHQIVAQHWLVDVTSWVALDQFFVLSGFLITTLLLREAGRTQQISIRRFYARRVARLLPMIGVAFVTAFVLRAWFSHTSFAPTWLGVWSIPGYFSNWAVIVTNNWGELASFNQLWSLAVEEQFYIVWPITLVVVLKLGGRQRALAAVLGAALVAMLVFRRHVWVSWLAYADAHARSDPAGTVRHGEQVWKFLYSGSITRPDGLLVGCILAVLIGFRPQRPGRKLRMVVGVLGTVGFAVDVLIYLHVGPNARPDFVFRWGLFVFNVGAAATILHLLYSPRAPLGRFYGLRPLVWLGQRSYAIYVIHLVIIQAFGYNGWVSVPALILANILIVVIGGLCYSRFEKPLREAMIRRFGAATPPSG